MEFTIRLAERNIGISSLYNNVFAMCRDYLTDGAPDFRVSVAQEDIERERERSILEAQAEGIAPVSYPDGYLETLAVYRSIVTGMLQYDTLLIHGAVIAVGGQGWLFTAPSGTGKTTHIRLWLKNIPGSYVVNGDKPLIHVGDELTVFGTPWSGKEGMQKNTGVKLCGIIFLERGAGNRIEQTPVSSILPTLIQQTYRPPEKAMLEKTLALTSLLVRRVPFYRLQCNMEPEAALTAYEALSGSPAPGDNAHER